MTSLRYGLRILGENGPHHVAPADNSCPPTRGIRSKPDACARFGASVFGVAGSVELAGCGSGTILAKKAELISEQERLRTNTRFENQGSCPKPQRCFVEDSWESGQGVTLGKRSSHPVLVVPFAKSRSGLSGFIMTTTSETISVGRPADVVAAHRLISDLFTPAPGRYWLELVFTGSTAWVAILLLVLSSNLVVAALAGCFAVLLWYRAATMIHELKHQRREAIPGLHLAWNLVIGVAWLLPSVFYEGVHHGHHKKTTFGTAADPEYLPLAGRPWAVVSYLGLAFLVFPSVFVRFLVVAPVSWMIPPLRRLVIRSASSYVINLSYVRRMSRPHRQELFGWECIILLAWWPPVALTLAGELSWRWLVCWYAVYTVVLLINRLRMLAAHHFASD